MTTKGERNNPEINLAHELSHADDAGHGRLVDGEEQFVKRNEWQAMYNENLIRGELGLPYRLYYRVAVDPEGNVVQYLYPKFIVKKQPIKPTWY